MYSLATLRDSLTLPAPKPNPIDGIPITPKGRKARPKRTADTAPRIEDLPTKVGTGSIDEIVGYKPSDESGSEVIGTRIPIAWLAIIDEILNHRRWPLKKRGEFFRWSIHKGMVDGQAYLGNLEQLDDAAQLENSELDSTTQAYMFTDRIMGLSNARSTMIGRIQTEVRQMAKTIKECMDIQEFDEATKIVMFYVDNALLLQGFWRNYTIHALFADLELREMLASLIRNAHIRNEVLMQAAVQYGAITEIPQHNDDEG